MSEAIEETDITARYRLSEQVGYLLRLASQRHATIFQALISEDLTATQFSTLIRIAEHGHASQNHLGRMAAMDVATVKGVVDRLKSKGLVTSTADPKDKRRSNISLTHKGAVIVDTLVRDGLRITEETLRPLTRAEQRTFLALLAKLG
ncbi:Transcriptional regulator, MarR family [Candidatus Rhodobacter oscarellae]|uniref:Transcriptional regulator, MarR family n=1 Tax=Candidatus Rhodobacter oscarellae TaxID=1675527 RepID=A0A0J9EBT6_9RHOB|nr:MarR family transcriptional regulator [Candidatus Rhodobacter lobularis]KMW60101.1 Transcriptional regulator, MarR family [Candidatus Rhodobacter lobularis]